MSKMLLITVVSLIINAVAVGIYVSPKLYAKYMAKKKQRSINAKAQLTKQVRRIVNEYLKELSK